MSLSSKDEPFARGGEITPKEKEPYEGSFSVIGICEEVFAYPDLSLSEERGLTRFRRMRDICKGVFS